MGTRKYMPSVDQIASTLDIVCQGKEFPILVRQGVALRNLLLRRPSREKNYLIAKILRCGFPILYGVFLRWKLLGKFRRMKLL